MEGRRGGEGDGGTKRVKAQKILVERLEGLERCPRLIFRYCGQGDVTAHFT